MCRGHCHRKTMMTIPTTSNRSKKKQSTLIDLIGESDNEIASTEETTKGKDAGIIYSEQEINDQNGYYDGKDRFNNGRSNRRNTKSSNSSSSNISSSL